MVMNLIFHITLNEQWQNAKQAGVYRCASLDSEGFIHCSRFGQVAWVANSFLSGAAIARVALHRFR